MFHYPTTPSHSLSENQEALAALQDLELELRGRRHPTDVTNSPAMHNDQRHSVHTRDLTELAVWTVSTAKPGNGVEQLLDRNTETYWQSDGPQPHTISAQFVFKVSISEVQIYLNYDKDESYTPAVLSVHAGSNFHDLKLVRKLRKLRHPHGWIRIPLGDSADLIDEDSEDDSDIDVPNAEDLTVEDMAARSVRRQQRQRRREQRRFERQQATDNAHRQIEQGVNGRVEALRDRTVTKAHMIQITIHSNHQNGRDSHVRMIRVFGPEGQIARKAPPFKSLQFQIHHEVR